MLKHRLCSLLILLSLSWSSVAAAQIRSATITGTVVDPQKAIVPGATVVITNEATNVSAEFVTTDAGLFTAPLLQAGTYTVTVTLSGFATFKRSGIAVGATETTRVTVELTVSQLGETVNVTAEAPLLQTDKSSVSGAVSAEMIEALPNITQNPLAYAFSQPGVVPRVLATNTDNINSFGIGVDGRRQWSAVGINGGRAFTNDIQLDGLPGHGRRLQRSRRRPEHRGPSGSPGHLEQLQRRVWPRPGRHLDEHQVGHQRVPRQWRLHDARRRARREHLREQRAEHREARRSASTMSAVRSAVRSSRNRLFFFSSYHGLRNNQTSTALMTVPTALERVGNFSQTFIRDEAGNPVPARIFDPFNVVQEGPDLFRRAEFPNAIIPNPDPYALRMFGFYPMPNRTPEDVFNRTTSRRRRRRRCGGTARTTASTSSSGTTRSTAAAASRTPRSFTPRPFGAAPFNDAAGIRSDKNPYIQLGDAVVAQPDARARRPLRAEPDQHQEPRRQQDGVRRLRIVRRAVQPPAADSVPRQRAEREPQRLWRRQRRRQQLDRADDRQLQHQAGIPDQPQRHRQPDEGPRQVGAQGRPGVPQPDVELRRSRAGLGRDAVAVRAPGWQLQLPVRDGERRRGVARERPTRSAASTPPACCSARACGGFDPAPT